MLLLEAKNETKQLDHVNRLKVMYLMASVWSITGTLTSHDFHGDSAGKY